ncbi:MAG: HAMP domain-containing histidine kinase, partial [Candidatus Omnitrophica bacterium]|nr:HAMP domain-containing histidine kinase [Candidatus Omnitrophota bacterium]
IEYRLMDITLYVARATIFTLVTIFIIASSLGITSLTKEILIRNVGENWWYIPLLASMILAAIGYAFSIYIIKKMDEMRLTKLHEAQEALEISGRGMIEIDDVNRLSKIIPRYLTMVYYAKLRVKIMHATIFLIDKDKREYLLASSAGEEKQIKGKALLYDNPLCDWFTDKRRLILDRRIAKPRDVDVLRIDDINYWMQNNKLLNVEGGMTSFLRNLRREMEELKSIICVPSFFKSNLIGFLLLGNKGTGMYNEEELDLFARLATNAAAAFRSAQLSELIRKFEEEKAETEKLIATGELLNSVSHEIGNLLNNMGGAIQSMYKPFNNGDKQAFQNLVDITVDNMMKIKTIRGYIAEYEKKSEAHKISIYSLTEMIDKAIANSNGLIEKWNIKIFSTIDPRISIKGRESLELVFKHLVINSCYGMETKGGDIDFSAKASENMIEIRQSDTGVDLAKEIKDRRTMGGELFAEQLKQGGISLFLARRVIKDHSGSLDIESNDGRGTRFVIRLPLDFTKVAI